MREIKFRGMRISDGEWVYGDLLHIVGGYVIYHGSQTESQLIEGRPNVAIELYMDEVSPVFPETVGQYTGLHDEDGREIYEGDIVRTSVAKDAIGVVEWNNDQASFVVHMKGRTQCYPLSKSDKIIGNIHDNPELLR